VTETETESVERPSERLLEQVWICESGCLVRVLVTARSVLPALLLLLPRGKFRLSDRVDGVCLSTIDPGTGSGNVFMATHALLILIDSLG